MKIHFIGVCGKLNAGLAVALQKLGHDVTGSDKGFFPPISTYLERAKFPIMIGFKEEHIDENNLPDIVTYNATLSDDNPEVAKSKKHNVKYVSPTELLGQYAAKQNSIVVTGTAGKTTITALLVKIFTDLGFDPNYMIGGDPKDLESPVNITNSNWSIFEGDEYPAFKDGKSKFFYYKPKYTIITSCEWDHTDIFKTEEIYIQNFQDYVEIVDKGKIIANQKGKNIYKLDLTEEYNYDRDQVTQNSDGTLTYYVGVQDVAKTKFIFHKTYKISPIIFGNFNLENISAILRLLECIYTSDPILNSHNLEEVFDKVAKSIEKFSGVARRQEIKFNDTINDGLISKKLLIIDDFAHNPAKFDACIDAVSTKYNNYKIIAIIEPNLGNRTKLSLQNYTNTFENKNLYKIIIPRFKISNLKEDSALASEEELCDTINTDLQLCEVIKDDKILIEELTEIVKLSTDNIAVIFMGTEPFRGMIDELVKKFS